MPNTKRALDPTPSILSRLAQHLAANHVSLSVDRPSESEAGKCALTRPPTFAELPRLVAVIGAGASHAGAGLPLAKPAAATLRAKVAARVDSRLIDEELERTVLQYRLNADDFETQLLVLSKFDRQTVLDGLGVLFNHRFKPTLCYEVLAHLLKHRCLDAVINFNFDELLDQSIEDEVGAGNYYRVVFDGDAPDDPRSWQDETGRFRLPLYIKPHGTASHKSSLRFTRGDYVLLPPEVRKLLEVLVVGAPVVLIAIGYAMESVEFNAIIEHASHTDSELYVFKRSPLDVDCDGLRRLYEKGGHCEVTDAASLEERMRQLWRAFAEQFTPPFRPRGITRHELIAEMFGAPVNRSNASVASPIRDDHYLRDRTCVELALAVAKSKGFITLSEVSESRAGHYFGLYKRANRADPLTLHSLCSSLGFSSPSYSREAMRLGDVGVAQGGNTKSLIVDGQWFERHGAELLCQRLGDQLSANRRKWLHLNRNKFTDAVRAMYDGEEVEIAFPGDGALSAYFRSPAKLSTFTSLRFHTQRLLAEKWDVLLVIAETAQWLLQESVRTILADKRFGLMVVLADDTHATALRHAFSGELIDLQVMPWWLHNQHMTLVLRRDEPIGGIYLERRLRASSIAPMLLDPADSKIAFDTFLAYSIKARMFSERRGELQITPEMVAKEREDLRQRLSKFRA